MAFALSFVSFAKPVEVWRIDSKLKLFLGGLFKNNGRVIYMYIFLKILLTKILVKEDMEQDLNL